MVFFLRKSCISSVAARVTGNSPSAPASPTEEVDRWKACAWSYCFDALLTTRAFHNNKHQHNELSTVIRATGKKNY